MDIILYPFDLSWVKMWLRWKVQFSGYKNSLQYWYLGIGFFFDNKHWCAILVLVSCR